MKIARIAGVNLEAQPALLFWTFLGMPATTPRPRRHYQGQEHQAPWAEYLSSFPGASCRQEPPGAAKARILGRDAKVAYFN